MSEYGLQWVDSSKLVPLNISGQRASFFFIATNNSLHAFSHYNLVTIINPTG